jgi:hypothetical protein
VCRVTTSLFVRVLAFAVFIGDASGLVRENKSRQLAWRDCQIYTRTYTVLLYPPAKGGPAKHVLRHRCTITIMQPCIILAASVKRMKATMRLKRRRRRTDGLPYYIEPLVRHPSGWFLDPHTHAEPNHFLQSFGLLDLDRSSDFTGYWYGRTSQQGGGGMQSTHALC